MQVHRPKDASAGGADTRERFDYNAARKRLLRHFTVSIRQRPKTPPWPGTVYARNGATHENYNQTNHEKASLGKRGCRADKPAQTYGA
ncbi:hypothetical protein BURKHO8Y_480020 [Burkholderia sp. 8Y]|nr:hypothetical protein BURKHO8Y_480020 [Burkholderia sp. 8Y]